MTITIPACIDLTSPHLDKLTFTHNNLFGGPSFSLSIRGLDYGAVEFLMTDNISEGRFHMTHPESLKQIASLLYGVALRLEDNKE